MSVNKTGMQPNRTCDPQADTALEILQFLCEEAMTRFPAFPAAFGRLIPSAQAVLSSPLGTDGIHLFFHPGAVCHTFLSDSDQLRRCLLHVHIHCLCLHIIQTSAASPKLWDLACDLSAALLCGLLWPEKSGPVLRHMLESQLCMLASSPASDSPEFLKEKAAPDAFSLYSSLHSAGWLDAVCLLPLLEQSPAIRSLAASCASDTHSFWIRPQRETGRQLAGGDSGSSGASPAAGSLKLSESVLKCWENQKRRLPSRIGRGQRSGAAGKASEEAGLVQRDTLDYRRFLQQFAVFREEPQIDLDSFDYIPYYFGLTQLSDENRSFPLVEPLEYSEVSRLDELAIAIDTSGSCSGKMVRRFLEETWSILSHRENFFSRMRLHLIQCDSMIQEHRIFTSLREWEAALPGIRILGQGNTDFRPVFELLEKQIARKEIRHLRGLLYFTDGDGIYPSAAPSFRTAFVFLNDRTEKHKIPDWAIRLNLHLPDSF